MHIKEAEMIRKAIESLINAKLQDAIGRPGGLHVCRWHARHPVAARPCEVINA